VPGARSGTQAHGDETWQDSEEAGEDEGILLSGGEADILLTAARRGELPQGGPRGGREHAEAEARDGEEVRRARLRRRQLQDAPVRGAAVAEQEAHQEASQLDPAQVQPPRRARLQPLRRRRVEARRASRPAPPSDAHPKTRHAASETPFNQRQENIQAAAKPQTTSHSEKKVTP
jgi:hypothetical protein